MEQPPWELSKPRRGPASRSSRHACTHRSSFSALLPPDSCEGSVRHLVGDNSYSIYPSFAFPRRFAETCARRVTRSCRAGRRRAGSVRAEAARPATSTAAEPSPALCAAPASRNSRAPEIPAETPAAGPRRAAAAPRTTPVLPQLTVRLPWALLRKHRHRRRR